MRLFVTNLTLDPNLLLTRDQCIETRLTGESEILKTDTVSSVYGYTDPLCLLY